MKTLLCIPIQGRDLFAQASKHGNFCQPLQQGVYRKRNWMIARPIYWRPKCKQTKLDPVREAFTYAQGWSKNDLLNSTMEVILVCVKVILDPAQRPQSEDHQSYGTVRL